jgi:hypothetical protein
VLASPTRVVGELKKGDTFYAFLGRHGAQARLGKDAGEPELLTVIGRRNDGSLEAVDDIGFKHELWGPRGADLKWDQNTVHVPASTVTPGGEGGDNPFTDRLAAGIKDRQTLSGLTGGTQAKTEIVTTKDGTQLVRKTYVPLPKGSPDQSHQADAEVLGAKVAAALGLRVPETARVKEHGTDGVWMTYEPGVTGFQAHRDGVDVEALLDGPDGARMTMLDALIGNGDRHDQNFLVHDGQLVVIDHSSAWHGPKQLDHFAKEEAAKLSQADVDWMTGQLEPLHDVFAVADRPEWYNDMLKRLRAMRRLAKAEKNRVAP